MDLGDRSPNRLVQVLERFTPVKFRCTETLGIYSLDAEAMQSLEPLLMEHRGNFSYLSLHNVKDLRLQSSGEVLPLLHVQWGIAVPSDITQPVPGYIYMFCAPTNDALTSALAIRGIYPQATASIISHGMEESDWQFILTSDI